MIRQECLLTLSCDFFCQGNICTITKKAAFKQVLYHWNSSGNVLIHVFPGGALIWQA